MLSTLPHQLLDESAKVVAVASAMPGEGTSTLAREIALLVAGRFSKTVLLLRVVDDPLSAPGLEATVHGNLPVQSVVRTDPKLPALSTADLRLGDSRPGLLFDESELELLFAHAARLARLVIVDAPAILSSVTTAALAPRTFGVLLVARADRTRASAVAQARRAIERNGGRILGAILNKDG